MKSTRVSHQTGLISKCYRFIVKIGWSRKTHVVNEEPDTEWLKCLCAKAQAELTNQWKKLDLRKSFHENGII